MTLRMREQDVLGGFDPRSIGGLLRWYDASYPSGLDVGLPSDNTGFASILDLSGNGVHLPQAVVANRPLWRSANKNPCPRFESWTFTGGCTLDGYGVLSIPQGGVATGWVPTNGVATATFSAEYNAGGQSAYAPNQPNGGRLLGFSYFAADKVTPAKNSAGSTSNGSSVPAIPVGSFSDRMVSTLSGNNTVVLGPLVQWLKITIANDTTYGNAAPLLVRLPQLDLPSGVTEYVPPSVLPLFTSSEVRQRWALQVGNSGLPLGKYTMYLIWAAGNIALGSRWLFGTRSDGVSSVNRSMALLSTPGSLRSYGPGSVPNGIPSGAVVKTIPVPRAGALHLSTHTWPDDSQNLGVGIDGTPFTNLPVSSQISYGDFSGPLCLLGYGVASSISGGIASALLYKGLHDTPTRKRVERWLGARAGMSIPAAA
jgi:hypothetical protein